MRQLRRTIQEHLAPFVNSACMEVAERACHLRALLQLLAMAEDLEGEGAGAGKERDATLATCMAQLDALFVDELMPVSVKAQKRVPVPMELDLEVRRSCLASSFSRRVSSTTFVAFVPGLSSLAALSNSARSPPCLRVVALEALR